MKRLLILVTAVALTICLAAGCVEVETYTDEGQAIDIGAGQQFVIALGSNLSTGYSWQASYDEAMLELIGGQSTYKLSEEGQVGAGGVEYFRFQALKVGKTEITLVYKRSWEEGFLYQKVFTVNID